MSLLFAIVIKGSLVMLAAFAVTRILRHQAAALRHLVWVLAFAGMLILPVTLPSAPRLDIPIAFWQKPEFRPVSTAPTAQISKPASALPDGPSNQGVNPTDNPVLEMEDAAANALAWTLFVTWCAGFLYVLGRALVGLYSLRCLRAFGTKRLESDDLAVDIPRLVDTVGLKREWELRQSSTDEPASALTWGVRQPVVLFPAPARAWSAQRQEAVLLHELAHVRRHDFLSQLLAEAACALYWFNPLVWLGARAMRMEAESAADDAVLRSGLLPSTYAEELLRIAAEIGRRRPLVPQPGIPVMNPMKIEVRLKSVLSPVARRGITQIQALAAITLAIVAVPAIAGLQATSPTQAADNKVERTESLSRIKQAALATMLYCSDYDDYFPYVQQTPSVVQVLMPYAKNNEIFQSPRKGGKFLYNLNIGGVVLTSIEDVKATPLWLEVLPNPADGPAIAYVDGHAKILNTAQDFAEAKTAAAKKHIRPKNSKPLPPNYLVDKTDKPY